MSDNPTPRKIAVLAVLLALLVVTGSTAFVGPAIADSGVVLEAEPPGFSIFAVSIEPTDEGAADEETADGATADTDVSEQTGETTTADTAGTTEGFAPGFGVVAALVALLAVAAFARRRQ